MLSRKREGSAASAAAWVPTRILGHTRETRPTREETQRTRSEQPRQGVNTSFRKATGYERASKRVESEAAVVRTEKRSMWGRTNKQARTRSVNCTSIERLRICRN